MTDYAKVSELTAATVVADADLIEISQDQGGGVFLSKKVTGANSINAKLASTGATTGATSQAQAFTNGIITGKIYPSADSTTAVQINKANGTTNVLNVDTTNGRVGIGGTPSEYDLEVRTSSSNAFGIVQSNTAVGTGLLIKEGTANASSMINYGSTHSSLANQTWFKNYRATGPLIFSAGGGSTAHLFVKSDGNVGIGTTGPVSALDVASGNISQGGAANNYNLNLYGASNAYFGMNTATTGKTSIRGFQFGLEDAGAFLLLRENLPMYFRTNSLDRMVITNAGNVGIGTTGPTANLQVAQGTAGVGTVSVSAGGTAWTGVGTQFLNTFKVGDSIISEGQTLTIATITTNTALTTNAVGAAISGKAYTLTGGTRFSVLGNGNVGIGTTSPTNALNIVSSTDAPIRVDSSNASWTGMIFNSSSATGKPYFQLNRQNVAKALFYVDTNNTINISTDGNGTDNRLSILNTGNVGIGTITPGAKLDIQEGAGSALRLGADTNLSTRTNNTNKVGRLSIPHYTTSEEDVASIIGWSESSGNEIDFGGGSGSLNAATKIIFFTAPTITTLTGTERMRIDSAGNVGIGTTAPTATLQVKGTSGNIFQIINSAGNTAFTLSNSTLKASFYAAGGMDYASIGFAGTTGLGYGSGGDAGKLGLITNDTAKMVIDTTGNVGIGTTAPSYKLDVRGTASTDAINTNIGLNLTTVTKPAAPTLALVDDAGAGLLGIGTYYYSISYVTALGETGVSSSIAIVTDATHKQVTVTLPISTDAKVTGRRIYRTTITTPYSWISYTCASFLISNNTATSYQDNIADATLGTVNYYARPNTTNRNITLDGSSVMILDTYTVALGPNAGQSAVGGSSVYIGGNAGPSITTGSSNVAIGQYASYGGTSANNNIAIGPSADFRNVTGAGNIAIGRDTLSGSVVGQSHSYNTAMGHSAGVVITTGDSNTMIGRNSGAALTSASNNIFLGAYSGKYETGDNKLFIDGLDRTNEATGRTNSLIYGVMSATPANQILSLGGGGNVGIGTTTPGSKLTVSGHIGSLGTIPTLTSAGTGASITTGSTDTAGEITQGTSATGAVITFATAYTNIPFVTVTSQAGLAFSYTVSTTAITITNIGALSETKLNYHVIARE